MSGPILPFLLLAVPAVVAVGVVLAGIASVFTRRAPVPVAVETAPPHPRTSAHVIRRPTVGAFDFSDDAPTLVFSAR